MLDIKCQCGIVLCNKPGEKIRGYETHYPHVTFVQYRYGRLIYSWCCHGKTTKRPKTLSDWLQIFKDENALQGFNHELVMTALGIRCTKCELEVDFNKDEEVWIPFYGELVNASFYYLHFSNNFQSEECYPDLKGPCDPVKVGCDENYECRWDCSIALT